MHKGLISKIIILNGTFHVRISDILPGTLYTVYRVPSGVESVKYSVKSVSKCAASIFLLSGPTSTI